MARTARMLRGAATGGVVLTTLLAGGMARAETVTPPPNPDPNRYVDPEIVTPGFIGLFFFVLLGVATYFLWRSMNRQLKRIDFDDPSDPKGPKPFDDVVELRDTDAGSSAESGRS